MLMNIRLELGRTTEFPNGDKSQGYEFVAPLTSDGHVDPEAWAIHKEACTVRHFRHDQDEQWGLLRHVGHGWRFDYDRKDDSDDERVFKLDRHVISPGLYVSITEHGGIQRPFKIASVTPVVAARPRPG